MKRQPSNFYFENGHFLFISARAVSTDYRRSQSNHFSLVLFAMVFLHDQTL